MIFQVSFMRDRKINYIKQQRNYVLQFTLNLERRKRIILVLNLKFVEQKFQTNYGNIYRISLKNGMPTYLHIHKEFIFYYFKLGHIHSYACTDLYSKVFVIK